VKAPRAALVSVGTLAGAIAIVVLVAPLWLPLLGTLLAVDDPLQVADVALVLEGTGLDAPDAAEAWRQQGIVRDVVIVEAPVKTHALVAYWSDFVRWGLAPPATTPPEHLSVVRAQSTQAALQASAALPALQSYAARQVLVAGGGGIGSRLVKDELASVLDPAGISVRLVRYAPGGGDPSEWYKHADDRRAVLDTWLQVLVPYLSEYQPETRS
jgi:hypothetical protein